MYAPLGRLKQEVGVDQTHGSVESVGDEHSEGGRNSKLTGHVARRERNQD